VEHTSLLTLLDVVTLLDGNLTGRDLVHADTDEGHEANGGVVGLDEDDGSCGEGAQVTLTGRDTVCVDLLCVGVTKTFEQRLAEVCAVLDVSLLDGAADGSVPAVVRESRQEGLVDGTVGELLGQAVVGEHVSDTVRLALDPESVSELCALLDLEGLTLTGVVDDVVIVGAVNGTDLILEVSGEEVVPRSVTVVLLAGVTDEEVLELVVGLVRSVGNRHHVRSSGLAEPAGLALVEHTSGLGRHEELAPLVEDLLEHLVDLGVEEGGVARRSGHGVVQNGAHWHTNHTDCLSRIGPDRCRAEDVVEDLEHVLVVTNLLASSGIPLVDVLVGNFLEHGSEVHVHSGCALNELLEFLKDRNQRLLVLVGVLHLLTKPLVVSTVIRRQPSSGSELVVSNWPFDQVCLILP